MRESNREPLPDPDDIAWALGYLRGSADGYWRGTVTMRRVVSAVRLALRYGASPADVWRVLRAQRLDWSELRLVVETSPRGDDLES